MTRVLITGGCGFLGSAFLIHLHEHYPDWQLLNYDLLTYAARPARLTALNDSARYTFARGDVADSSSLTDTFSRHGPFDLVFHFAAETHVDRSLRDSLPFVHANVKGTQVILDCFRRQNAGKLLHISTDEVYGPAPSGVFFKEDAPLKPRNPYAATKAAADHLVQAAVRSFGIDALIIRSVNVYGPGQYPEKFIPLAVTSLQNGRAIPLYGDGQQVRDWLYVDDYVRAVTLLADKGSAGDVYNVSAGDERPNVEVAEAICALMSVPVRDGVAHVDDRPGHDRRYGLDSGRIRGLGWRPEADFGSGLRRTIEWHKSHPEAPAPAPKSA
jgi:dTDP-glucose 4,6-dehydratase